MKLGDLVRCLIVVLMLQMVILTLALLFIVICVFSLLVCSVEQPTSKCATRDMFVLLPFACFELPRVFVASFMA